MKTEIPQFCQKYSELLAPLAEKLRDTIARLKDASLEESPREAIAALADVQHRLKTLQDKIQDQQAYLLIFGPLKSGKSTLMNAISGAYVSEVTSLPAYPCLVFVRHSDETKVSLTRYNGRRNAFTNKDVMHALVTDSHSHLAERIREVEETGGDFDPGVHFPEAIRRIDIEIPARSLAESGTVLVDTPGLYSSMKFGYDLMTREFRHSAACAVFVVKTDNLFLEQVFEEFHELLGLFTRVFLVVNIDTSKRDLAPDGTLRPSLEGEDPTRIIEAFESLSMSAPLRRAFDDGRLKIYKIDLLNAAADLLRRQLDPNAIIESATAGEDPGAKARAESLTEFQLFLRDLTEYLNSSDYLQEFINDSLQQGLRLCHEIRTFCIDDAVASVEKQHKRLERFLEDISHKVQCAKQLATIDWEVAFEETARENIEAADKYGTTVRNQLSTNLLNKVDEWFESSDGLEALQDEAFTPELSEAVRATAAEAAARVQSLVKDDLGGAEITTEQILNLDRIQLSLSDVLQEAQRRIGLKAPDVPLLNIEPEIVPVKRTFLDLILLRGKNSVRRRFFGSSGRGRSHIGSRDKKRRLIPDGKAALMDAVREHVRHNFFTLPKQAADIALRQYVESFRQQIHERLEEVTKDYEKTTEDLKTRLATNQRVGAALEAIREDSREITNYIELLGLDFHCNISSLHAGEPAVSNAFTLWTAPYTGAPNCGFSTRAFRVQEEPWRVLDEEPLAAPASQDASDCPQRVLIAGT